MTPDSFSSAQRDQQFVGLITQHQSALSAFCHGLVPDSAGAEEILQEANLVIWNKRSDFEPGTNFRAWAFKIVRFQVLAWRKREARRAARFLFDDELVEQLAVTAETLSDSHDRRLEALRGCLEKLDEGDRALIDDHYEIGLPMEEHARRAGRSVGALRQVLYRIRNTLRLCVQQNLSREGLAPGT